MKAKERRRLQREVEQARKEAGLVSVRDLMNNPSVRQAVLDAAGCGSTTQIRTKGEQKS